MNPSKELIEYIQSRADWKQSDEEICATLNAKTVPNPTPCPMVPRTLRKNEAFGLLQPASQAKMLMFVNLSMVFESFDKQDYASCLNWTAALAGVGLITADDRTAVNAYISELVPDPTWQAEVPELPVDLADVWTARKEAERGNN